MDTENQKRNPYITGGERQKDELRAFRLGLISYESIPGQGFQPKPIPGASQRLEWVPGLGIVEKRRQAQSQPEPEQYWAYCSDHQGYALHEQGNCQRCGAEFVVYHQDKFGLSA